MTLTAKDISAGAVSFARERVYQGRSSEFSDEQIFAGLTKFEIDQISSPGEVCLRVKDWIREGIARTVSHADIAERFGFQDIVFSGNFLRRVSWGLEAFDRRTLDCHHRYASVFRVLGGES